MQDIKTNRVVQSCQGWNWEELGAPALTAVKVLKKEGKKHTGEGRGEDWQPGG
jgi:hypothetical protein